MKKIILLLAITGIAKVEQAQNVGIGTTTPDASAQLDISSTTQGLLIPRMTLVQRNLVASPATGLIIYQNDNTPGLYTYNGAAWQAVSAGGGGSLTLPFYSIYGGAATSFEIDMLGSSNNTGIKSVTYNTGSKGFFGEARGNNSIGGYFTVAGTPTGAAALQTDVGDVYLATTSGNVGINMPLGTATEKLQVDANMKVGNSVWSGTGNDRLIKFGDGSFVTIGETGQDDRMSLAAKNFIFTPSLGSYSGNIGINTTTPASPLSFGNIIGEKINFWNTDATHNYGIGVQTGILQIHSNDATADIAFGSGISSSGAGFAEKMRIKGNGNVGIGTSTPGSKLDVLGNVNFTGNVGASGASSGFRFDDRTLGAANGWQWYASGGKTFLYDQLNGLNRLAIDNTGNVGIGTTTPGAKLEVNGTFKLTDGNEAANRILTSDAAGFGTWTDLVQPLVNQERFKISGAGAVNLGGGNYIADFTTTLYNYSGNIVIDNAANTITFNTAGLYRLEFANHVASSFGTGETVCYLEINGTGEYVQYIQLKVTGTSGELHFTSDRYMPAGTVLRIYFSSTTAITFYDNYLAGYLIAE